MRVAVIGGGISGLACAYKLRQLGAEVILPEKSNRAGGVIGTIEKDGFLFELGPQSFLSSPTLLNLISELGLEGELLRADNRAARFVYLHGQLRRAPMSPPALVGSTLLSWSAKLRLFSEPFRRTRPPAEDETVASFVRRKFGEELLEHLVAPFVSGVYAGDSERISLRAAFPSVYQWENNHGSVIRGAMKSRPPKGTPRPGLCSFRRGMGTLVEALARSLGDSLSLASEVRDLHLARQDGKTQYELQVSAGGTVHCTVCDAVVVATPAGPAADLLRGLTPRGSELLAPVEYAPVAVVCTGYRRDQIGGSADGFGFLVPRNEGLQVLGTVWNSSLFPGRAPAGMATLTSFVGGATAPGIVELDEGNLLDIVTRENSRVMAIRGTPVSWHVQVWKRAIAQYNVGHQARLDSLRAECSQVPGLFVTGSYFDGPAIGACVEHASRTAEEAFHYISSTR